MESRLPGRQAPGPDDFDTHEAAVKQWVADLPVINIEKTWAMLHSALREINALDITPGERYAAIELLAKPVLYVTDALKKQFLGKDIPLKDKYLAGAQDCLDLYNLMATAYEIMAADLGRIQGSKSRLATALHRAMRYLGESLLTNYQIYQQYPAGIWRSIHTLYTAAENENRTSRRVTDNTLPTPRGSSIETVYKQILLLSLACPYRLRQKEIYDLQQALFGWSSASTLAPAVIGNNGLFAVNLLSDEPPSYSTLNREEDQQDLKYMRTLDTGKMADLLRKEAARAARERGSHNGSLQGETLKRLMLAWGVMPKRRFDRHQAATDAELIVGLDAIHNLLESPDIDPAPSSDDAQNEQQENGNLEDPTFEGVTRIRAHPVTGTQRAMTPGRHSSGDADLNPDGARIPIETWKISDMSAEGYRLQSDCEGPTSARVGELIAIRTRDEKGRQEWQLGVSRRIRFSRDHGLELGLQLLSPGARPVWTGICRDGTTPTTRMKGILLPGIKSLKQASSLLLPSLPFRVGSTSVLEHGGSRSTITLTRQVENTGIFGQYNFAGTETNQSGQRTKQETN